MASGGRDDDRSTGARPTASTSFSASSGYSAKETGGDARGEFESPRQPSETSQALLDELRRKNAAMFSVEAPSGPEQGQGPAAEAIPTEGATETAAEAQPQARRAKAKPVAGVPGIWLFFVDPEENSDWLPTLAPQDVIFFWGGKVASGAPYNTLVRAGDTVLVLAGDRFVASGVLGGGSLRTFVDGQGRRRWPVRMIDVFKPPVDRADLGDAGRALVSVPRTVHPVRPDTLAVANEALARRTPPIVLPYPDRDALTPSDAELGRALAEDGQDILPDARTAKAVGWTGKVWDRKTGAALEGDTAIDVDAKIPFVSDAPADEEDDLERGPFALFLARRLHLIWCQMNGVGPGARKAGPAGRESDTFIVHIDAPWGGGKTTFANFVAAVLDPRGRSLSERHFLRSSLAPAATTKEELEKVDLSTVFVPDFAKGPAGADQWPEARRPWIIVRYNAWRDQYVQPPWWQIFLSIQLAVFRSLWAEARPAWKPRDWPRAAAALARAFAVGARRFSYQIFNAKVRGQLLLIAFAGVFLFALARSAPGVEVLRALGAREPEDAKKWIDVTIAVLGIGGISLSALLTILAQSFSPDLDFTSEHKHIGVGDPIERFRRAFTRILELARRPVLLIVDDIDRCEPKAVVEIMRGFQTIIRSPRLFVLLLGDRSWIETAHEIEHKEQLGLSAGGESGLGARFVEKVIQLSYRLPAMKSEARETFAKIVLGARQKPAAAKTAAAPEEAPPAEAGPSPQSRARRPARATGSAEETSAAAEAQARDRLAVEALRALDTAITDILGRRLSVAERERLIQAAKTIALKAAPKDAVDALANLKLVAAAGGDATQQTEVFNAVTRLAASLPNNPRQIKRIFMAFGVYETVGRVYLNYQLTPQGPEGEVRARRWRQLAIWVALATEWPETWRAIACEPRILAAAYAPAAQRSRLEEQVMDGLSEAASSHRKAVLWRLRNDPSLVALLTAKARPEAAAAGGFTDTAMEVDAVYDFNRIIWEPGFAGPPAASAA